jgi:hypothetical protein
MKFFFAAIHYSYSITVLCLCLTVSSYTRVQAQNIPGSAMSGIDLIMPYNNQDLQVQYPLFSWSSNLVPSGNDISYQIKIVEVIGKQTAATAIYNPPVFEKDLGFVTVFQYPVDAPELQKCKQYAWQIIATDKKNKIIDERSYKVSYTNKIAQSVPFLFRSNCNQEMKVTNISTTKPYIILSKTVDNFIFPVENSELNFKYIEDYAVSELHYKIYNWKRQEVMSSATTQLQLEFGWNYLSIDLNDAATALNTGEVYQLEVETPKGDIYKAKFELK